MKKSKLEAAETRRRILKAAAEAFRRNGIHATGVADVMATAGLTHGGFYRHFASKDQLVAEVCTAAMESLGETDTVPARENGGPDGLEALVGTYLSPSHRDQLADGCLLAGLGSELARSDKATRAAATAGFLKLADMLAGQYRQTDPKHAKARALVAASAMIGAVTMARVVTDPKLSAAILKNTKEYLADL